MISIRNVESQHGGPGLHGVEIEGDTSDLRWLLEAVEVAIAHGRGGARVGVAIVGLDEAARAFVRVVRVGP